MKKLSVNNKSSRLGGSRSADAFYAKDNLLPADLLSLFHLEGWREPFDVFFSDNKL